MSRRGVLVCVVALALLAPGIAAGIEPGPAAEPGVEPRSAAEPGVEPRSAAEPGLAPQPAADRGLAPQPAASADVEYDSTLLRIDLEAGGDAAWTVEYRIALDDQNSTEAFESLREDIRSNRSAFESQFADRMNRTARTAENATGREMAIRNVSVSTRTSTTAGIVSYTFTWTDFANASGDELRAGDAISGLVLDSGTTLFVSWPAEFGAVSVTPDADERRAGVAIWNPPETFAADEPRIVLERGAGTPTANGGTGPTDGGTPTDSLGGDVWSGLPLFGIVAVALLGLGGVGWYLTRRRPGEGDATGGAATNPGEASAGGADGGSGEAAAASSTAAATEDDDADEETPPEELLSNEERVLRLLEDSGGRMKQQQVVQELGWTDAKTSQVVGSLREEEEIEVFRIGRENVLALPDETDF